MRKAGLTGWNDILNRRWYKWGPYARRLLAVCLGIYVYVIKNDGKIQSLRKYQNKISNLTVCKTEFRDNILFEYNLG